MTRFFAIAGVCVTALLAGSCAPDPSPFQALAAQHGERSAAGEVPARPMLPLPTTLQSRYLPRSKDVAEPSSGRALGEEPAVNLTLQEIIQRSVANSPEVRVASFSPAIEKTRITEAEGRFDPSAFFQAGYEKQDRMSAGNFNPFVPGLLTSQEQAWIFRSGTGVRQNLESGGRVQLTYTANYTDDNPDRFLIDPYYENNLMLELEQPLLANFGAEVNRARIVVARNNRRIALLDFREALEDNVIRLEEAYWQLVEARRNVEIQERLLQETQNMAATLRDRFEGGLDVTRIQTSQAVAAVEQRRIALIDFRSRVRDLSDQIKRRMNDPDLPVSGNTLLLPASEPVMQPVHFDMQEQIDTAMQNRLELAQQQLRIDSASIASRVAKNNLLPDLSLRGTFGVNGVGDDPGEPITEQWDYNHQSYSLAFELEIPIGNRVARAIWARSLLQRQQAIESYRNLVEQIALDLKQAHRAVETRWDEMAASRAARFAAADALQAIEARREAQEALTPTFVQLRLDRQEALAEAERQEISSIINYNITIAELERRKGTLLRYNNILMEEEALPFTTALLGR